MPPYRLIFSGDVKIYENLEALARAFLVFQWQSAVSPAAAVEAMRAEDLDPRIEAVVIGDGVPQPPFSSGQGTVSIVEYRPESVVMRAVSDIGGLLVITDANYPGWQATVDGEPATLWPVDGLFRGVFVPPGEHDVVMTFRPNSYRLGVYLSSLGVIVLIVLFAFVFLRRGRLAEQ